MFLLVSDMKSLSISTGLNFCHKIVNKRKFRILDDPVLVTPDEIFNYFIDVKEDLTMEADLYLELSECATDRNKQDHICTC